MKTVYAFCILFLVISGQALAQIKCTYCMVRTYGAITSGTIGEKSYGYITRGNGGPDELVITSSLTKTFNGDILLYGESVIRIIGYGHYKINGEIISMTDRTTSITLTAPDAGNWGGRYAGITLTGSSPNTYRGPTIIKGGYIACNKSPGVVAIPGDIIFSPTERYPHAGLWFGANHQLSGNGKIIFETPVSTTGWFSLNGTTQSIAGFRGRGHGGWPIMENIHPDNPTSIPGITINKTDKAVLIIKETNERCEYGGSYCELHNNPGAGGLEIRVEGTRQAIQNVNPNIKDLTYHTVENAILELYAYGNRHDVVPMGANIIINGNGTIKKTGVGLLSLEGTTMSQSGGRFWVAQDIVRNNSNTNYPTGFGERNQAVLHLDNGWSTFDLYGVNSIFRGLTGTGTVENNWKGYRTIFLEPDYEHIFGGEIRDNQNRQPVSETEIGNGGVVIWKAMNGTQVLTGISTYTGRTEVSAGTLKLIGGAMLGNGIYTGDLKISNSREPAATFEHNGTETQIFTGNITFNEPDFVSNFSQKGIFRQSGTGKSILNGAKDFTGNVEITRGFLGGSGDLSKVNSVTVGAQGSLGGGQGTEGTGATLTVANLNFSAASSTLLVTTRSDNTPSLTEVKTSDGSPGTVTAANRFTVDLVGDNLTGGYLIKCSHTANLPMPILGQHNSAKSYCFNWDATGLLMTIHSDAPPVVFNQPSDITGYSGETQSPISFTSSAVGNAAPTGYQWRQKGPHSDLITGLEEYITDWAMTAIPEFTIPNTTITTTLRRSIEVTGYNTTTGCMAIKTFTYTVPPLSNLTCDNCSFTRSGNVLVTGTTAAPVPIISNTTGEFTGDITLNGPCNFTINNSGNYILSGEIKSAEGVTTSLTYNAPAAGEQGKDTGVTLAGNHSNTYTGLTSLTGGYLICNKTTNTVAIPHDMKISAASNTVPAHLWCKADNQLGSPVVDFRDAQTTSALHLNGTTQHIAGLKGNNLRGVVENWEPLHLPASMANEEPAGEAILNIAVAANTNCLFGGGGQIRRGTTTQAFTVNVTGGTQIIESLDNTITNVTFASSGEAVLEFNTGAGTTDNRLSGITLKGSGTIKKTGTGVLAMTGTTVLKSGGQIWVAEGTLRNDGTTYFNDTESNGAILRVDATVAGSPPVFDLWGNNSIFGGLTGDGVVQNNFASEGTSPGGGYNQLLLKLTGMHAFTGTIRDNSGNVPPESNGGQDKGGVALKIEGNNQIQSLSGVNRYTGSTTLSSGKLVLTEAAQLGNGTYAGVLEISNGTEASHATFEHNGIATQIFTGNITASGEGAVKGIFLQSGMGKSIMTGAKTFAGDINITGGFLGGTGTLGNVNSVNLEGNGGIGGGNGVVGNGDTFTVKNLTYKSESAKLIVTAKSDNTPSILEVQSLPAFTNLNRFTVDILAASGLQSGYLLKYPDHVQLPASLPTPAVGVNNTGKGVRFNWDNVGLRMQISNGAITLALRPGSVCPRGSNPVNAKIRVDVTYSDDRDIPATDAVITGYFTLSDNSAKSGDITVSRSGSTITAEFDGANPTAAILPYAIIYDDQKSAVVRAETHINRMPLLSISTGWNPACLGAPLILQGAAKDGATISSQHTAVATVSSTSAVLTATVTTLTTGEADFLLTDNNGCKSEYLSVVVLDGALHITAASSALCAAVDGEAGTTTLTADQDPAAAPAIAWTINPPVAGASVEDVTAGDREAQFSVTHTTLTEQQQFTIEYTGQTGCKAMTIITVNPNPVITPANSSICAVVNGAGNHTDLQASQEPASASAWVLNPTTDALIEDVITTDRLVRFSVSNTTLIRQKQFTIEYTSQSGCKGTTAVTVNPTPVVSAGSSIDLAKLCAGLSYAEALTVSGVTSGNWAVYRTGLTTASTISTRATASAIAGRGNIQAGNATTPTVENVVFISEASCTSSTLPITVYPKPVMNKIADRAYCHDTDIPAFTPLSSGAVAEAKPTHYQWYLGAEADNRAEINLDDHPADWTMAAVSSFRSPNIMTPLRRDLTIRGYNSTSGCASEWQVFTIAIKNGLELTHNSTSPICNGTGTHVFLHSSLSDTKYTWTVSDNSVGAAGQTTPYDTAFIKQRLTNSGNSAVSVTYSVRAASGTSNNCVDTAEITVEVSHTQAITPTVTGAGNYCVNHEGNANTYQTNLIPGVAVASAEWVYTSGFPRRQAEVISGNTQKRVKGPVAVVADNLILSGQASALVNYVFRPFTDCLGAPSDTVRVRIYPVPATPVVANSAVCSSSADRATTTHIVLDNSVADLAYTWTVDKTSSPDVSGYTEPSREGAVVPTTNPVAATRVPVADHLLLAATDAQTIIYNITPWRNGCPGQAASAHVMVNPLPVVNPPNNRQYCPNSEVTAEPLTGTHGANSFKWSGGLSAGLADQVNYGQGLPAYTTPAVSTDPVTVQISAKNEKGCESAEATFTLAVIAKPTLILGTSRALCTGPAIETAATVNLGVTLTSEVKYKWIAQTEDSGAGGMKIITGGVAAPIPYTETTLQEGDIIKKITATAGSTATIAFNVQPFRGDCAGDVVSTQVQVTGNDLTAGIVNNSTGICNASPLNIKVGNEGDGNTYSWTVTDNTGNAQGYNQRAEASAATLISDALTLSNTNRGNVTYTFTTLRGECDGATISHTVFVNPVPLITVSSRVPLPICSGANTDIRLTTDLGESEIHRVAYSWTVSNEVMGARPGTGNPGTFEQQKLFRQGTEDGSVTYTFIPHYISTDGKGSCEGQPGTIVYTVRPHVETLISDKPEPRKVCLGDQAISLSATAPEGAAYQWLKDDRDIPDAVNKSYEVQTNTVSSSTYTVRVTTGSACAISDSRRVEVTKDAYFTGGEARADKADEEVNKPVNFTYTAPDTNGIEYSWDFKDDTGVADTQNASHSYLNPGPFLPTLIVVKKGQPECTKTFVLSVLRIAPMAGDLNSSMALSVFPLPALEQLTIVNEGEDMQNITIRDISGKRVVNEAVNGRKATLQVGHLGCGIYLLTVTDSKGVRHLKISKK